MTALKDPSFLNETFSNHSEWSVSNTVDIITVARMLGLTAWSVGYFCLQ